MTVRASCVYKNEIPVGKPLLMGYYQDMHESFNLYVSFPCKY